MKKLNRSTWMVALLCLALAVPALALQSKYVTGTSSADLTFGPRTGGLTVKSVYASTDKEDGAVKFYARGGAGRVAVLAAATNGATVITVANSSYGLTNGDDVVYWHSNGAVEYDTIDAATTTNVTLTSGLSSAGTTSDYIYEITQQGQIVVGYDGAGEGISDALQTSGDVFATPGDSPLYVVLDGTAATVLQVTVDD
jgi:hypothetical protein